MPSSSSAFDGWYVGATKSTMRGSFFTAASALSYIIPKKYEGMLRG